jgi:hypothetical protein
MVGKQVVHSCGQQQQTDQVRLSGVRELAETNIVKQIVGQPDLPASSLELAKIAEAEILMH